MSESIKDLQKQIRGIMPQNTLNGEKIATDIAEWMVGEGYNKFEKLDTAIPSIENLQDIIQDINFKSFGFSHEDVARKISVAVISEFKRLNGLEGE